MQTNIKIELTRYGLSEPDDLGSYLMTIKAKATNLDSEIFIYHASAEKDPYNGDVFQAVVTPNHIQEIPKNKPYYDDFTGEAMPFYRKDSVTIVSRSLEELDVFWDNIKKDVNSLVENYKAFENLKQTDVVALDGKEKKVVDNAVSNMGSLYTDPATKEDLSSDGEIVTPDKSLKGWLPIASGSFNKVPKHAKLFYNLDAHPAVKRVFDFGLLKPVGMHRLLLNSYDYGSSVYSITEEGIFWKDYDPEEFRNDPVNLPKPTKNPWPDSYKVTLGSSDFNVISFVNFFVVG